MEFNPHTPLAGERLQPLGHLSEVRNHTRNKTATPGGVAVSLLIINNRFMQRLGHQRMNHCFFLAEYANKSLHDVPTNLLVH